MDAERKVSGRGGWKTTKYCPQGERELNAWDKTQYEKYQEYCERVVGYPGAVDHMWYVVNQSIVPRSL